MRNRSGALAEDDPGLGVDQDDDGSGGSRRRLQRFRLRLGAGGGYRKRAEHENLGPTLAWGPGRDWLGGMNIRSL